MSLALLSPHLVLLNGRIHTVDPRGTIASAVAIQDGRFLAVGTDDEVRAMAGPATPIDNLGGATVVPGLIDAHNHLLKTGIMLGQVQLYDCRTLGDVLARVAARARQMPPGTWIVGRGWDESLLAERRHPTRHDLDAVAPDHPVVIHRVWNKLVANSAALRLAGISRQTPDPPADIPYAGSFERDEHGEPTGLFRDRAKDLVTDAIPAPTEDELAAAIAAACRAYNTVGLTGVAEPGLYPPEIDAFHRAADLGLLTVRTEMLLAAWGFGTVEEEAPGLVEARVEAAGAPGESGDDLLRIEGVKLMVDGGVSDRTAKLGEPYVDEPGNTGVWVVPPDQLEARIRWVHDRGWPMDCHTCGDEAQAAVVRAYAAAQSANPKPWLRHRVHHAYLPTAETIRLMAAHQIPALVSNPFLTHLGEGFVGSLGAVRAARMMPMRSYLDAGVPLAGTSDSAIADFNPWVGIAAAVNRTTVTGRPFGPEERITVAEALRSYTLGGAFATGQEERRGSIQPGKLADLVVLDRDPLAVPPAELTEVRAVATMVGGRWVVDGR